MKYVVAILCAVCFLAFAQGTVTRALAAEEWETWPKKGSGTEAGGAADAGKAGGEKTYAGMSAGTVGWIAGGAAVIIGIAVIAGGGGGDSGSSTPAHH
ncbi:MAG: hypothetical protein E4G97_08635 [Deltaproteobacteria bacterium]|nr:MAG: hypothetical protein E4G97_08635 [Deltaproteobacteria bacterium]